MVTEHLPIEGHPNYLVTTDRQRANETNCYGCMGTYGTKWPFGSIIALITDRSGSVQADAHNRPECIAAACERLDEDEYWTF